MNWFALFAQNVPTTYRKALYKALKYAGVLATVYLLIAPHIADLGMPVPEWVASVTAVMTFVSHLADSNTQVETNTDYPAVETQDVPGAVADTPTPAAPAAPASDTPNPAASATPPTLPGL